MLKLFLQNVFFQKWHNLSFYNTILHYSNRNFKLKPFYVCIVRKLFTTICHKASVMKTLDLCVETLNYSYNIHKQMFKNFIIQLKCFPIIFNLLTLLFLAKIYKDAGSIVDTCKKGTQLN